VVASENGAPTKTYTVTVSRGTASDDTTLFSLDMTPAAAGLAAQFAATKTTYMVTVASDISSTHITPTVTDTAHAIVTVNGRLVENGKPSTRQPIDPDTGATILIVVTAEDRNVSKTYKIIVTREGSPVKSDDAYLNSVILTGNTGLALVVTPAQLSQAVTSYSVAVPSTVTRYTVSAKPVRAASRMRYVNDRSDMEGNAEDQGALQDELASALLRVPRNLIGAGTPFQLLQDTTVLKIIVTAENGMNTATYFFHLKRDVGAPPRPRIVSVTERVNAVTLEWEPPSEAETSFFHVGSDTSGYRYRWSNDADAAWESAGGADGVEIPDSAALTNFTLRGLTANAPHTLQMAAVNASGTGAWSVSSREARPLTLPQGAPTALTLTPAHNELRAAWEAPATGAPSEYRVRWARGLGSTNWLNPNRANGETTGTALRLTIGHDVNNDKIYEVQIGARLGADITWGDRVTAVPGAPSDIHTVTFCDSESVTGFRGCDLPVEIVPAFDLLTYDGYTLTPPFATTALRVRALTSRTGESAFQVNNAATETRADHYSPAVALPAALGVSQIVSVRSTLAGARSYTFTVTRAANTALAALAISPGALSPPFDPGRAEYAASLEFLSEAVRVTPTAADPGNARITVNGESVASGQNSAEIALDVGVAKAIAVEVRAGDDIRVYTLTLTRQPVPLLRFTSAQADVRLHSGGDIEARMLPMVDAASGAPPFAYSLAGLPDGLLFDGDPQQRMLSGMLEAAAATSTFTLRYQVRDSSTPSRIGTQDFRITIAAPLAFASPAPLALTFAYNAAVSETLPALGGGFAPYVYSLSGDLPPGLRFTAGTRLLDGTPTQPGAFPIVYQARDDLAGELRAAIQIVVPPNRPDAPTDLVAAAADRRLQLRWSAPAGVASGGEAPSHYLVRWRQPAGNWVDVSADGVSTGSAGTVHTIENLVNGTPYEVQVAAVNSAGRSDWSSVVEVAPAVALAFTAQRADAVWFVGIELNLPLPAAENGVMPYVYALVGSLPDGLSFNAATHTISGAPTAAGLTSITYTVTDDDGDIASQIFSLDIRAAFSLDVDDSGAANARDGILIARYLLGVTGAALVDPQVESAAREIAARIQVGVDSRLLDVNDDGDVDGDDGIIIARHLLGLRGQLLVLNMPPDTELATVLAKLALFSQ